MSELVTLEYTTPDIEPIKIEQVKISISGTEYVARCPNDYEFFAIVADLKKLEREPWNVPGLLEPILSNFFSAPDAERIHELARGEDPTIDLFRDLLPALQRIIEHYTPLIKERLKSVQKMSNVPKGR